MTLLNFLKSRAQKQKEIQQREEESKIDERLAQVRFFPGSVSEYAFFIGYGVRIIDLGERNIGIFYTRRILPYNKPTPWRCRCLGDFEYKRKLVTEGVEAIVNCI